MADHYAVLATDPNTFDQFIVGPFFTEELASIWAKQDAHEKCELYDLKIMSEPEPNFIAIGDGEEVIYEWQVYKMIPTT